MNNLAPWYVILWRLLFLPILYLGLIITFIGLLLIFGKREAKEFWMDNCPRPK